MGRGEGKSPLEVPDRMNLYRSAFYMILHRMLWDLRIQSWISRGRLKNLLDTHVGEKAVVLCNGPSLNKVDFDLLIRSDVFTFGLNKINLLFNKHEFRPSCIVSVNPFVIKQNAEFYRNTKIPLFLDKRAFTDRLVSPRPNLIYLDTHGYPGFSRDCSISMFQGYTVTYVALQLAFHMGFRKVAIVGADHEFCVSGDANATVVSGEKDDSHFDPSYFSGGQEWHLPDLIGSEHAYLRAKKIYELFGGRVVNSSEGGMLESFDRQDLNEFLNN